MSKLIGNDFDYEKIKKWYEEETAYFDRYKGGRKKEYCPIYEFFNEKYALHKYCRLSQKTKVLSFGCAEGLDTEKLYKKYGFQLYGLDSSEEMIQAFKKKYPDSQIKKATIKGTIDYPTDFFDYVFAFSALHHIPNVSFVIKELYRVTKKRGRIIIREPISSMRPLDNPNPKELTPNERGMPIEFFKQEANRLNLKILSIKKAAYAPFMRIVVKMKFLNRFARLIFFEVDNFLCSFCRSPKYYRKNIFDKFAPGIAYYIFEK